MKPRTKEHCLKLSLALKGKKKSIEQVEKMREISKKRLSIPENNPNYRWDKIGVIGIHGWLRKYFWKPAQCEHCWLTWCSQNGKWNIAYAKKTWMEYERKRENFLNLCNKCHRKYDDTLYWRVNVKGRLTDEHKRKLFLSRKWTKHSDETKKQMSESRKRYLASKENTI